MAQEILAVAIWQPFPDMEAASLSTIRELITILAAKGYSRDLLYRDKDGRYVLLRYWKSEDARRDAQEDPEVQRRWAKLGNEIQILKVYERLNEIAVSSEK